ncbi:MAG: type II toxin-antitoxin system VapC family toxin, partial [Candidatus Latescibacteria bacterium]|nr:type II toxin-antitoxin system VapC family toxin [Candidatus Latescibacterota bacterium]
PTLYLETTILSYLAARPSRDIIVQAHQQITWDWWESERENYELYISEIVLQEIMGGDPEAAERRQSFISNLAILDMSDAVRNLAYELAKFLNLLQRAELDALHLSFAIEYEMDYLLTWNCSHLANGLIISRLKEFELETSRLVPVIITPEELMSGGEENEMD